MLLVGAGLFLRTLRNLQNQNLGFESRKLLLVQFLPEAAGYLPPQLSSLYNNILQRVDALPGVRSATLSSVPVINPGQWGSPISILGYAAKQDESIDTVGNFVAARYFETVGIPMLLGRPIGPQDTTTSSKVVVVNQTFANDYFPGGNAIGRSFTIADPRVPGTWQIVGVARDAKYSSARETPQRMIYLPLVQIAGPHVYAHSLQILTVSDPARVGEEVRRALAQIDPNLAVLKMETITQQVDHLIDQEQLISQLCTWFAGLALLLTSIGLYGVMTYNVARRTHEIGDPHGARRSEQGSAVDDSKRVSVAAWYRRCGWSAGDDGRDSTGGGAAVRAYDVRPCHVCHCRYCHFCCGGVGCIFSCPACD